MVAGMLAELGCWTGSTRAGDQYNPKGYFENTALKRALKVMHGFDLLGPFPKFIPGWRHIVRATVSLQGYAGGPWLFKTGAHYSGVWDEFNPIVVKVTRDRDRIIDSYARYGGIWHAYGPEGTKRIVDRGLARLWNLPGIEIDADQLIAGDDSAIRKVCNAALIPYRKTDFIVPGAFHAG